MQINLTAILKKWKLTRSKLQKILDENNVKPLHGQEVEINSMVYLQRYTVTAKYFDAKTVEDILKDQALRG